MCLIVYSPDGHIPVKHLKRGLAVNPDGWGVMIWDGQKAVVEKGMTPDEFWAKWELRPEGPTVFHARIGTHGRNDLDNCHPFPVPGHDLLMAHNGIISQHARSNAKMSDTRRFIRDLLTDLPRDFLANGSLVKLIADYVGYSKLVFMSELDGQVDIVNESRGHWYKGRWYSNASWQPPKPKPEPMWPSNSFFESSSGQLQPMSLGSVQVERKSIYTSCFTDEEKTCE